MTGLIPYDMFDNFFGDRWMQSRNISRDVFKIDVKDTEKSYIVEAELPGISKDQVDLSVDDKMLSITVISREEKDEENENYIHRERRTSSMSRKVRLQSANMNDVTAKLDNGILTVTVPKYDETAKASKIEIQ